MSQPPVFRSRAGHRRHSNGAHFLPLNWMIGQPAAVRHRVADGARFGIGIPQLIRHISWHLISEMFACLHTGTKASADDRQVSSALRFGDGVPAERRKPNKSGGLPTRRYGYQLRSLEVFALEYRVGKRFINRVKMETVLPLDRMTLAEKLREMEALWADLSRNEAQFESPAWHGDVLHDRAERVKQGQESFIDWETAKKQLREKLT